MPKKKLDNPNNHHIYNRKGIYWVRYTANGVPRRESLKTTNIKLAREIRDKILGDLARGVFQLPEKRNLKRVTFEELSNKYIVHSEKTKKSARRDTEIVKLLNHYFVGKYLNDISSFDVESYKSKRKAGETAIGGHYKAHPANGSINRELAVLKNMFNMARKLFDAREYNLNFDNPVVGVKFLKNDSAPREDCLEPYEIEALIAACNETLRPIVLTALTTGMRKSEITGLLWNQINLDQRDILLPTPKGGKPVNVKIPPNLETMLREMRDKHMAAGGNGSEFVFVSSRGIPYGDIKNPFTTALEVSGIAEARRRSGRPTFRFHDLRHTFASQLAMSCGNLIIVQRALGHKDPRTTARYSHITDGALERAISGMTSQVFSGNDTDKHDFSTPIDFLQKKSERNAG
ncbi:MAG: site-specific integrase [bacterium]